jgi:hypothetical protein
MKFCTTCGNQLTEGCFFCNNCGASTARIVPTVPVTRQTDSTASLLAIVFGILGVATLVTGSLSIISLPANIVAIITGIVAMKNGKRLGYTDVKAKTGLILGCVGSGMNLLYTLWMLAIVVFYVVYFVLMIESASGAYVSGPGQYM